MKIDFGQLINVVCDSGDGHTDEYIPIISYQTGGHGERSEWKELKNSPYIIRERADMEDTEIDMDDPNIGNWIRVSIANACPSCRALEIQFACEDFAKRLAARLIKAGVIHFLPDEGDKVPGVFYTDDFQKACIPCYPSPEHAEKGDMEDEYYDEFDKLEATKE